MLGWMRSAEEVGLYKAAYQTASVIPFAMMAVNLVISPSMSQLHTLGDRPRLRRLVILATGMSLAFAVPFVVHGSWSRFLVWSSYRQHLLWLFLR
jgi:O-antigen/teichoic acid export membrane protein